MAIVKKYKYNWDNAHYVAGNHKMVLDIQRTARKNMTAFQKKVTELIGSKQFIVSQANVSQARSDLEKKFKYYRLSLYTFSMASLMEVMLSGNYREENISDIRQDIGKLTEEYHVLFEKSVSYLKDMSSSSLETNVLKGVGAVGKAFGGFLGSIPLIKETAAESFLKDGGNFLEKNANGMEAEAAVALETLGDPGTEVFMNKMRDMIRIYNHTEDICFDHERIYLVGEKATA